MTIDMTGQRFGKLLVIRQAKYDKPKGFKGAVWLCQCDCGSLTYARGADLRKGMRRSCGCINQQLKRGRGSAKWAKYGCAFCADRETCKGSSCKYQDELEDYGEYIQYEMRAGYAEIH